MIHSNITDNKTRKSANVVETQSKDDNYSLIVSTLPLRTFKNDVRFFVSDVYGVDMNINTASTGSSDKVYNADDTLWSASDIVGGAKTTFVSGDQNHTGGGNNSLKVDNSPTGDIYQLAEGNTGITVGDYVSLSMWIYVDKDWGVGDSVSVYGWDTTTNTQVGNKVYLETLFNYSSYDVWQKIVVPFNLLGFEDGSIVDALRFKQEDNAGKSPKYYLDDIQFERNGAPVEFTLEAEDGSWLYVDTYTISIVNSIASTLADATMPNLDYNSLLGVSLDVGLTYKRTEAGEIVFTQTAGSLMGVLELPGTNINAVGSDGTNTFITINVVHPEPLLLKSEDSDVISWTVNDNLSDLLQLKISAGCRKIIN